MTIQRNGFQSIVNTDMPPAIIGAFASMNPRATVLAGQGGLKADGAFPVVVGNFAFGSMVTLLASGSLYPNGGTVGFVANELQTVITDFLGQNRVAVQAGFPVTLYTRGDFWAFMAEAVTLGAAIFADRATGAPTVSNGAFSATGVQTAASNILTVSAVTLGKLVPGDTIAGSGVAGNTVVLTQTSGTPGGAGTYTVSNTTGFASTTITVAAPNVVTGFVAGSAAPADASAVTSSIAANTGVLTLGTVTGVVEIGDNVSGTGVPANLFIKSQLTGSPGATGTYQLNYQGAAVASFTAALSRGRLVKISRS